VIMAEQKRVINFSAGPATLPTEVLLEAQADFYNYKGCGMNVMEMSHRTPEYTKIITEAEADLREILKIPDNYKVLFLQGGATGQFAGVPLNLCKEASMATDYVVTGAWSSKAVKEAEKYCKPNRVNPKTDKYISIAPEAEWVLNPKAEYLYYCSNETIHGVEFSTVPNAHGVNLVCDMSSNFCSKPVDVSKYALIYAGAQKNIGPAGVTIVIVRDDMIGKSSNLCPIVLDYKTQAGAGSMYNTPPTYNIYMCGLVFKWLKKMGGLDEIEKRNIAKSGLLYDAIDNSNGFYVGVVDKPFRSRMNVPFRVGSLEGNDELEKKFITEAKANGMVTLKGHRSVGGLRASLYNALTLEEVQSLVSFMKEFQQRNQ